MNQQNVSVGFIFIAWVNSKLNFTYKSKLIFPSLKAQYYRNISLYHLHGNTGGRPNSE